MAIKEKKELFCPFLNANTIRFIGAFNTLNPQWQDAFKSCIEGLKGGKKNPAQAQGQSEDIPTWAYHAQTWKDCCGDCEPGETGNRDVVLRHLVADLRERNPQGCAFLDAYFSQKPKPFNSQNLAGIYRGLRCADYLDLIKKDAWAISLQHFVSYCADGFCSKPEETLAMLERNESDPEFNVKLLNNFDWDAFFKSLNEPIVFRHQKGVMSACINHDASRIVTTFEDGTAYIWDIKTGNLVHILKGHIGPVCSAQFNYDGSLIVTASHDNTIRIWDANTGSLQHTIHGDYHASSDIRSAEFSPDGLRIVIAANDGAHIWDINGKLLHTLHQNFDEDDHLISARFNRDGTHVITVTKRGIVCTWDASSGSLSQNIKGNVGVIHKKKVQIRDMYTGELLHTLEDPKGAITSVQASPNGSRIVTASFYGNVCIWDAHTGHLLHTLEGHYNRYLSLSTGKVTSAQFSPDGTRVITASVDGCACIWYIKAPTCTLEQALLIYLINQKSRAGERFDFNEQKNAALLLLFKTLDPDWQRVHIPFVQLPPMMIDRKLILGGIAATAVGYGLWKYAHSEHAQQLKNSMLLALFNRVGPRWQNVLRPYVQLPAVQPSWQDRLYQFVFQSKK